MRTDLAGATELLDALRRAQLREIQRKCKSLIFKKMGPAKQPEVNGVRDRPGLCTFP